MTREYLTDKYKVNVNYLNKTELIDVLKLTVDEYVISDIHNKVVEVYNQQIENV